MTQLSDVIKTINDYSQAHDDEMEELQNKLDRERVYTSNQAELISMQLKEIQRLNGANQVLQFKARVENFSDKALINEIKKRGYGVLGNGVIN